MNHHLKKKGVRLCNMSASGDIVFQVVNWQAFDYAYDDGGDGDGDGDQLKYLIKLYGLTEEGDTVSLNVMCYTPFFMIKVFHPVTSLFLERLREYVIMKLPASLRGSFLDAKLLKKKEFWGFHNDAKFNYVRLSFINYNTFKACIRIFQKDIQIQGVHNKPVKYKLYESNIEPFIRFMHIKDISPSGWIRIPSKMYDTNVSLLPTTSKIDISCNWKHVEKMEKDKIAPVKIASFDIECTSSHGDFPVARKDYKKVAYDLLQAFNDERIHSRNIVGELMNIFDHEVDGILNKVFAKEACHPQLKVKLQKLTEDIINILNGKICYKDGKFQSVPKASKDDIMKTLTRRLGTYDGDEWVGLMPRLEGDQIIQIGTTVHRYGETECYYKNIITFGSCSPIDGCDVIECATERDVLLKWQELIVKIDPDVMTGYNIFGFDFSYLYDRAKELGVTEQFCKIGRVIDQSCKYVEKTLSSSALGENVLKYVDMDGRVIIDVMKVVQRDHKLDSYKLDNVANHFMKMNKNDVSPNDIFRLFKGSAEDRKTIAEYCVQDCALCNKLIMKLEILANNIGMSNVCSVPLSFIFMRGQGVKIFSLVAKQCREDDYIIPTISKAWGEEEVDEEGYEGAIVLQPKEGIYLEHPVSVLDYASLYPSSMISENLSPDCYVMDPKYDNLPGVRYLDISYDVYEKIDDKKVKVGEKVCRFVDGEKGVLPRILMKLLKARKDTRKKMEYQTIVTNSGVEMVGLLDETDDSYKLKRIDGSSDVVQKADVQVVRPTYGEFEKAVLDGLQLAYKVTANSLYGQVGARTSPIYLKEIAACTTATGRKMILMAKKFLEENYFAEIVYGDSVTEYTPITIRHNGCIKVLTIDQLANECGNGEWKYCIEQGKQEKEYCEVFDVEAWTKSGWTTIFRVIRHMLAPHKKIIRINTHGGVVDVTDDHSLFTDKGEKISPKDTAVGSDLLHNPIEFTESAIDYHTEDEARIMGFFCGDGSCGTYDCPSGGKNSWALNGANMELLEKYRELCMKTYPELEWKIYDTLKSSGVYKLEPKCGEVKEYGSIKRLVQKYRSMLYTNKGNKIVPQTILNSSATVRESFWRGLYDADGDKCGYCERIDQKSLISIASFNLLCLSLGYKTSFNTRSDKQDIFRLTVTKKNLRKPITKVKKMVEIPYTGYVYDITTDNHQFQAGAGSIIVSNTDSIFAIFPNKDENGNPVTGKDALLPSINQAIEASEKFKKLLKAPHDLEYEKTFWPFILFSKKRYCAYKYEGPNDKPKMNSMGIALKRRDNAPIVKHIYGGCLDIILNEHDIRKSVTFLKSNLHDLIDGKFPLEDLVITKSLRADYKDPEKIAHKVLAERMGERDPGNKPMVNDRIPFVYIQPPNQKKNEKLLQGDRIEHPTYIQKQGLKPDYEFYITNQIMKPILQLYALTLESLDGYRKGAQYFKDTEKKLIIDKEGDLKKVKDRLDDLREGEVQKLLFDPLLIKLQNKKKGNREITEFFSFANAKNT